MAKRAYEDYKYQPQGVDQDVLDQISHLQNVTIVPLTTVTNSTPIAEIDNPVDVSIIPLINTDEIEPVQDEPVDAMATRSLGEITEVIVEPENSVSQSSDCTLDYMESTYCKNSCKILTQSDVQQQLIDYGSNLKSLKLSIFFDSRILITIRNHCPNIEQLELELIRYTPTHLNQAFVNMKNLKSIVVKNLESDCLNIFFDSLPINVEEISIGCHSIENNWEKKSLSSFNNLMSVKVLQLSSYDLSHERSHMITKKNKNTIVKLSLRNCKVINGFNFIFKLKNLVSLDLGLVTSSRYDGSKILRHLSKTAVNLNYLDMSGYVGITGYALTALYNLKNLEVLILNNLKDIDRFNEVIGFFSNLKRFECRGCDDINDYGIGFLFMNSKNLEFLDVSKTQVTDHCICLANLALQIRTNNIELAINIERSKAQVFCFSIPAPTLKVIEID